MKLKTLFVAALAIVSMGFIYQANVQALDDTPDCDEFAVIRCGVKNTSQAQAKYDEGAKIFQSFGISKADLASGTFKEGIVHRNGNVTVGGEVKATGAVTAIRNMSGGTSIAGTNAARFPTSKMADDQTALVKLDRDGRFLFAIIKPCGNPVTATPPPAPKPSAICKILEVTPVSRTKYRLRAEAQVENGATVSNYVFAIRDASGKVVARHNEPSTRLAAAYRTEDLAPGRYTANAAVITSVGRKDGAACTATFTVSPPPAQPSYVCDSLTVTKTSRSSFNFTTRYSLKDATLRHITYVIRDANGTEISRSRDSTYTQEQVAAYSVQAYITVNVKGENKTVTAPSCKKDFSVLPPKTNPCPVPGKEHLPPNSPECEYCPLPGKQHLPKDSPECAETPPVTPPETPPTPELPETGPLESFSSILGVGSIIGSGGAYMVSRRHLLAAWLSR